MRAKESESTSARAALHTSPLSTLRHFYTLKRRRRGTAKVHTVASALLDSPMNTALVISRPHRLLPTPDRADQASLTRGNPSAEFHHQLRLHLQKQALSTSHTGQVTLEAIQTRLTRQHAKSYPFRLASQQASNSHSSTP